METPLTAFTGSNDVFYTVSDGAEFTVCLDLKTCIHFQVETSGG